MLLECCKFGKVRGIQLLTLPVAFLSAVQASSQGALPVLSATAAGCVAVTFREASSAVACAQALGGKKFDGRLLIAHALPALAAVLSVSSAPSAAAAGVSAAALPATSTVPSSTAPLPPPPPPPPRPPSVPKPTLFVTSAAAAAPPASAVSSASKTEAAEEVNIEAISSNVDDFLNSLL